MTVHKSFESLSRRIEQLGVDVVENSEDVAKRASFAALAGVVVATPVDEGTARSNWNAGLGKPDLSTKLESQNSQPPEIIDRGNARIKQYKESINGIFISNNLNYIARLENGHSGQAPRGMLRHGVAAARQVIRKAKLLRR